MKTEPSVPEKLKLTQQWFGSVISRPIDENSQMNPISPSGQPMKEEAKQFIMPSKTMEPYKRIEIYNQQYWWRLLTILHDIFPLVTRLFGYFDFNQTIGIPYLEAFPPHTWSLNPLGYKLAKWIKNEYRHHDKSFVYNAATIDLAYNDGFFTPRSKPLTLQDLPNPSDFSYLLDKSLYLQSHIYLFELDYNLFKFRDEMLDQEPEYWEENDFPELQKDKSYTFCLFRNLNNNMCWEEIEKPELFLLNLFKKGTTIEKACETLEEKHEEWGEEALSHLSDWFQKWVVRGWLYGK